MKSMWNWYSHLDMRNFTDLISLLDIVLAGDVYDKQSFYSPEVSKHSGGAFSSCQDFTTALQNAYWGSLSSSFCSVLFYGGPGLQNSLIDLVWACQGHNWVELL